MATNTLYHVHIINQEGTVLADIDARSTADALQYFVDSRAHNLSGSGSQRVSVYRRKGWAEGIRYRIYESTWPGDPIVENPRDDFTYEELGLRLTARVHGPGWAVPHHPAHFRSPAKAYNAKGEHIGAGEWLDLIHEVNRLAVAEGRTALFLVPDHSGDWWAGGTVEEYRDARVLHRGDGSVSVVSKTDLGARLIHQAAANKGWVS